MTTTDNLIFIKDVSINGDERAANYGENALMIDKNGVIYLGNETSNPTPISNLSYKNILYKELIELRDNKTLIPGIHYRITDYITTTAQENTKSAGHQFDVIVLATSASELNENAKAIYHEGDTYFSENGANLDAWELKYSLDNDVNKFAWADEENGKGVIYYMKDEWNNECPYDFKNIMFVRYELNEPEISDDEGYAVRVLENIQRQFKGDCLSYIWGGLYDGEGIYWDGDHDKIYSTQTGEYKEFYTFSNVIDGIVTDKSITNGRCYNNVIKEYKTGRAIKLNNNVFFNRSNIYFCHSNSFGNGCYYNSFGDMCNNNSFGNSFKQNSFGSDCYNNSFGNNCAYNSFGGEFDANSFGNSCSYNSFGNGCRDNSFGNSCSYNSFGYECKYNSFGNGCYDNSFEDDCNSNSFGNDCFENSFGKYCYANSFGNGCYDNSFELDCDYNSFGNDCHRNSFGNYCYYNSFGNVCCDNIFNLSCDENIFGNVCTHNIFEHSCSSNSFGNYFEYNSFKSTCCSNSFGNDCNHNKIETPCTYYCHFDDGCKYVRLTAVRSTSSNFKLQNVNVNRGVCRTSSNNYIQINIENLNSEKEINVDNVNGYIYILEGPENVYKTTYENLVNLRDNSQLIPGLQYRIIDYMTTTSQESTKSANHQFDVIVTAIDDHTLSEDAKAAYSENDTYFEDNNANLSAWELKYSLDNDTDKFAWAGDSITTSKEVEKRIYDSSTCTINPELIDGNEFITHFNFESCVWVDGDGDGISYNNADGEDNHDIDELVYEWGYFTDDNGKTQLCLYKSDAGLYEEEGQPDYGDKYLYRGIITVDGTDYDYWQKWDQSFEGIYVNGGVDFVYATTPRIVTNPENLTEEITTEIIETTIELNPKGIIYYMKDEWDNECPYDFKNIMFVRYKLNAPETLGYGDWVDKMAENIQYQFNNNSLPYIWGGLYAGEDRYWEDEYSELKSTRTGESKEFYTFSNVIDGIVTDKSITNGWYCYNNVIKECKDYYNNIKLNNNLFFNTSNTSYCHYNSLGNGCNYNSFGDGCYYNSFGNDCYYNSLGYGFFSNSFGNDCKYNSFGNYCYSNGFGNYCHYNSFGNGCKYNSFGNGCFSDSFGNDFNYNVFGNDCYYNSFGNNCYYNSFGNNCYSNSFGNYCYYNSFGNLCFHIKIEKSYIWDCHFDGWCGYITLSNNETASSSNLVQNYNFIRGLQGTESSPLTIEVERNRDYESKVAKNSLGEIKVYCEADLIA